MTDAQVNLVLFHKRSKDGALVPPGQLLDRRDIEAKTRMPETLEEELRGIEALRGVLAPPDFTKLEEQVRSKWKDGVRRGPR